ncbi:succinylglutamate desuccinylase/aspartoacylase family protein [Rhodobacteraceae bacterium]|nr:succinylglutamate desuccinylase/aspartoacylase family protein [Paracoccaceae bacterium]
MHSGGKASFFEPCALATSSKNKDLFRSNLNLAEAFGIPLIWILGKNNDDRSLNSAAERANIAMMTVELGGGGVSLEITNIAETGLINIQNYLNILKTKSFASKNKKN